MTRGIDLLFENHPRRRNLSSSSSSSSSSDDDGNGNGINPSILIIGLIIVGVLLVSTIIHFLLRFITRLYKSTTNHDEQQQEDDDDDLVVGVILHSQETLSLHSEEENQNQDSNKKLIESLPLFSFESVTGFKSSSSGSADCAVCLSKFERHEQLRLLPICCHAFHSECIDMWLSSHTTCPLCRSTVNIAKSEDYMKLFGDSSSFRSSFGGGGNNDSFRIEIGSVSRRRISPLEETDDDDFDDDRRPPRSYSMGAFEYVVDDDESEVVVEQQPIHRRSGGVSEFTIFGAKDEVLPSAPPLPPGSEIAGEVAEGRGWLRDYIDKLASTSSRSFRFSGRLFTGSGRQSEGGLGRSGRRSVDIAGVGGDSRGGSWDLEGNGHGEEISNFFRWLSGV